jgi:hypothetical protein
MHIVGVLGGARRPMSSPGHVTTRTPVMNWWIAQKNG